FRRGKALDRGWQIRIGAADPGDHGANARQYLLEIDAVERPHCALGLAEVEDAAFAAGSQHTDDLAESGVVVGEIAETESGGHQIEVCARKRKVKGVGFEPTRT